MLVRSQNRKVLVKTEDIFVKGNLIMSGDRDASLGSYGSEERAIEVLNQMEYFMLSGSKYDVIASDGRRYYKEKTFQMPIK